MLLDDTTDYSLASSSCGKGAVLKLTQLDSTIIRWNSEIIHFKIYDSNQKNNIQIFSQHTQAHINMYNKICFSKKLLRNNIRKPSCCQLCFVFFLHSTNEGELEHRLDQPEKYDNNCQAIGSLKWLCR